MANPILLATDLSCRCDRALDRAVLLAREWDATLIIVHALETPASVVDEPSWRRSLSFEQRVTRRIHEDLGNPPPVPLDVVLEHAEPQRLILETAARRWCSLIVTGVARDEALGRNRLGDVVDHVLRNSQVPVLVVRSRAKKPYANVAVATDFSDVSRMALIVALSTFPHANVSLVHAYQAPFESHFSDKMAVRQAESHRVRSEAAAFLEHVPEASSRDIPILCEHGEPEEVLSEVMEDGRADLAVIGSTGRGWIEELVLGSVATRILSDLPGDIMVVPRIR
jgi:nucleotide-binding universal stress UspA family protein